MKLKSKSRVLNELMGRDVKKLDESTQELVERTIREFKENGGKFVAFDPTVESIFQLIIQKGTLEYSIDQIFGLSQKDGSAGRSAIQQKYQELMQEWYTKLVHIEMKLMMSPIRLRTIYPDLFVVSEPEGEMEESAA